MLSAKWHLFCLGLNVYCCYVCCRSRWKCHHLSDPVWCQAPSCCGDSYQWVEEGVLGTYGDAGPIPYKDGFSVHCTLYISWLLFVRNSHNTSYRPGVKYVFVFDSFRCSLFELYRNNNVFVFDWKWCTCVCIWGKRCTWPQPWHPIACPWWWDMGCLLVQSLINVLLFWYVVCNIVIYCTVMYWEWNE